MRLLVLLAVLTLAGCVGSSNADRARAVCADNGHPMGSPSFDKCFDTTYRSIAILNSGR